MTEKRDPWERRPGESSRAHEAFKIYLDLGASRSHARVAKKLGKSTDIISRWSRFHAWVERCEAWEIDQDREWIQERRRSIRAACRRHTQLAGLFTVKLAERIKGIDPNEITPADAARWLDVAVKVERLGLGMSTNNTEHTGKDGGPIDVGVDDKRRVLRSVLSDPEAAAAIEKLNDIAMRGQEKTEDEQLDDELGEQRS